jgi:hypothetical protein
MMMVPNIIGNIGGAEKYGFLTHYHTLYFPFLIFASIMGYIQLIKICKTKIQRISASAVLIALIVLSAASSPYTRNIDKENALREIAIINDMELYPDIFDKHSSIRQHLASYNKINELIPDGFHCFISGSATIHTL